MRLLITTPLDLVVDQRNVYHVRAEDDTGAFGILKGHADFLTVLRPTVISWRMGPGSPEHYAAVRGGMLSVKDGELVQIASREAVASDDIDDLEHHALAKYREEDRAEDVARAEARRLHVTAIHQIVRYLRPEEGRQEIPKLHGQHGIYRGGR